MKTLFMVLVILVASTSSAETYQSAPESLFKSVFGKDCSYAKDIVAGKATSFVDHGKEVIVKINFDDSVCLMKFTCNQKRSVMALDISEGCL